MLSLLSKFHQQILLGLIFGILAAIPVVLTSNITPSETIKPAIAASNDYPVEVPYAQTATESAASVSKPKEVIGFYPYWTLDKVDQVDLSKLTTVYYFALDLNGDGSWNLDDAGLGKLKSSQARLLKEKILRQGGRWGLTIVNLDQDKIAQNISNPTHQKTIIKNTVQKMKDEEATDLNIDLEYVGTFDTNLKNSFTKFVDSLTKTVKAEIPNSRVTIDFFADTYAKNRIFDLEKLGQIVDGVIIMGYDFHRLGSIKAGPIAPLFGKELFEYDVSSSVEGMAKFIPPEKIILGVPFYGYEWPTEDNQKYAFTIDSKRGPEISSYERSLETAAKNKASINFDDDSKSVWFSYFDKLSKTWRQVWFENQRSLGLKFDLVNEEKLQGIAIFALGYDGPSAQPLWDEVKLKLK